ncbi:MAG TPA: sulfatase [Candidatus Polarisedimenticolia bacterium]|nr:sulfatase [Candidatus Polarisedimenticolia bacterium]
MRQRQLATALAAIALALSVTVGCGVPARPNILLLVIDTARADRFPFNGYERPTAPAMAALAREGTVYGATFSPAPWTVPAHASLFTGQYPSLHRTDCGSLRLPDSAVTLAETLRDAGYRTAGFSGNPWLGEKYNFQQGFDTYSETWRDLPPEGEDSGAALSNQRAERLLRWRQGNQEARRQPFFIFINYFEPHMPYNPPEPERSRLLRPGVDPERVARLSRLGHPEDMRFIVGASDLQPVDLAILSDLYDGEIAYADRRAGEMVALLRELGLIDETVVVVAADHGENLGDHGMMDHKLSVHDTLLRVPLLLRYPKRVAAGRRIESQVQMHDLYPTLLALAGVAPPPGVTIEALPLPGAGIAGSGRSADGPIIGEFVGPPVEFLQVMRDLFPTKDLSRFDRKLVALRHGGYKIHWGSDGRHALYDVEHDPGEAHDLAAADPERLRRLAGEVEVWLNRPARRVH